MAESAGSETDVLVVGAGPTGLAMALELQRRGVDYRVVERNARTVETSRALGISPRTLQVFDDVGVREAILAEGFRLEGQTLFRGDRRLFRIRTDSAPTEERYPYLWILPQNRTERTLLDRLEALGGEVAFERELLGFRQDDDGVTARIGHAEGEEVVGARWLVACDGGLIRTYLVVPEGIRAPDGSGIRTLGDESSRLHDRFGAAVPTAYLVRPDDYVGVRSRPVRAAPLVEYLDDWLRPT